ncbi:MAG: DUF1330 domain-containing protein [Chitinophagaceae bacterium]|nr:DUF1330 domain-containing protein [Chitinophagaceae bacterium]
MKTTLSILILCAILPSCNQNKVDNKVPKQSEISENAPAILLVLDITVKDSAKYELYREAVEPLIEKYGGSYLVRSGGMAYDKDPDRKLIPAEGGWNPNRFIITRWKSMEHLQTFVKSDDYKPVAELRKQSAETKSIIVKEYQADK